MEYRQTITVRQWTLASFLGWLLGIILILTTSGAFDAIGLEGFQFYLGMSVGGGVGLLQWRVLRKHGVGQEWLSSSALGMGLPFLFIDLLKQFPVVPAWDRWPQLCMVLGALLAGVWQRSVVRRRGGNGSLWMFAAWAGWILAAATIIAVDYTKWLSSNNLVLFALNLTLILSGGAVLGAVTAVPVMRALASGNKH